jgi:hypothetical protein
VPAAALAGKLVFTRAYEGPAAYRGLAAATLLSIANPSAAPITVRLTLYKPVPGVSMPSSIEQTRVIAGQGSLTQSIAEIFSTTVKEGYVVAEVLGGGAAAGFELVTLPDVPTTIGLSAWTDLSGTQLFSAQYAQIPDAYYSSLKLINTSQFSRAVTLSVINDQGVNVVSPITLNLAPGEMLEKDANDTGLFGQDRLVGTLKVAAEAGVIGDVTFGEPASSSYATSLALQNKLFAQAVFSQVACGLGYFTGFALFNPSAQPADILVTVFSSEGVKTGEVNFRLESQARYSRLIDGLVPSAAGQMGGYFLIASTQPISGLAIFGGFPNMLSAIPPVAVQ